LADNNFTADIPVGPRAMASVNCFISARKTFLFCWLLV